MANPVAADGTGAADVAPLPVQEVAAMIKSLSDNRFPDDQRAAFVQAQQDLQADVVASGGTTEQRAEVLAADKATEIEAGQRGTSGERNDAYLLYVEGLARALTVPVKPVEEAASRYEQSFLDSTFVPGEHINDRLPDVVHIALPVVSLITSIPSNADRLQTRPPDVGARVRAALARRSLCGGTYTPVGGTAVGAGPVLIVRYESTNRARVVLLVVPRSSRNVTAWQRDLQKRLTTPPQVWGLPHGALVHAGFLAVASELLKTTLFSQIEDEVVRHARAFPGGPQMEVVWAGHSLGAALSSLLATVPSHRATTPGMRTIKSTLVTFGGPRVGNNITQSTIAARTIHTCVNTALDPVPGVPRRSGVTLYSAAQGDKYWALHAPKDGAAALQPSTADTTDKDSNRLTVAEMRRFLSTEHPLDNYLMRMIESHKQVMVPVSNGVAR